jgi:hypothetical protein
MRVAHVAGARQAPSSQVLDGVYMPSFPPVPPPASTAETIDALAADWRSGGSTTVASDLLSLQGALLALSLAVIVIVGWRSGVRPRSLSAYRAGVSPHGGVSRRGSGVRPRSVFAYFNFELLLLFASGALFFDVMRFFRVLSSPVYLRLLDWIFIAVVAVGLGLMARAVYRVLRPASATWTPRLSTPALAALALALLCANLWLVLARTSDDAGFFVNLGAQRLRERGRLPYGDPMLTGTPGAAYGPLLYAAHVPFQILLAPQGVNRVSPPRLDPASGPYYLPPARATQLAVIAFHLLGVAALFLAARRFTDTRVATGLVCLYAGSLAVLGIGGPEDQVAGLTFVSHIAPASMTLAALAALHRPALSGVLLVAAAGVGFYPAFMGPAWLGYYWNDRARRRAFLIGVCLTAVLVSAAVYSLSRPAGSRTRLGTIVYDTFGHHTDPAGYGSSPFGFWGQRGGVRRFLAAPLAGSSGLTSPAWLAFATFMGATFVLARGRRPAELALLAGAVAVGATLVKPHATGTYLAWFYGLLLLGFAASGFTSDEQKV